MYGGYSYIDESYEPRKDDFVVLMWVKGIKNIEILAEAIASESSVGTWTKIKTMNEHVIKEYRARIYKIIKVSENSGFLYIAYPFEHFDAKNILQFQASVLGNIFGLKELEELYILDISFPEKFQKQFEGPEYGLNGVRKYIGTHKSKRPHVGTIVKPKVGLTAEEFAKVVYDAWANGLDFVKDDENLVDQKFCTWKDRFDKTLDKLDKAETKTGEKKLYGSNITDSSIDRMVERVDYIYERGGKAVMLDVYIMGYAALNHMIEYIRKKRLIIHAHRAGYAAHERGNYGVNFQIYEKLYRILGVDQLHIGTGVGKMEGSPYLIRTLHKIATQENIKGELFMGTLDMKYHKDIKPLMPVASGGIDPTRLDALSIVHGKDMVAQAGGGVHGHPQGTKGGAKAMRQAAEAVAEGVSALEYAKKTRNRELKEAIKYFGYTNPQETENKISFVEKNKAQLNELVLSRGMEGIRIIWDEF